jgi:hypothetical protein
MIKKMYLTTGEYYLKCIHLFSVHLKSLCSFINKLEVNKRIFIKHVFACRAFNRSNMYILLNYFICMEK